MADHQQYDSSKADEQQVESTDRGLFGLIGNKEKPHHEEESLSSEFAEKTHVSEPSHKETEEKKKLHRSHSSSSSSSSDEEEEGEEEGEKKKKEKKDKKKKDKVKKEDDKEDKYEDTHVKIDKYDDEEKKGIVDKIKEKLPGGHKKTEDVEIAVAPSSETAHVEKVEEKVEEKEKKGFLEKIKEKLPGFHAKSEGEDHKDIKD